MSERAADAQKIVKGYSKWAAGAGLIPVPLLDVAVVTGVDLKMIAALARHYGIPFREDRVKAMIGALLGAVSPPVLSASILMGLAPALKVLNGVGTVLAVITTPAINAAATIALGRVFIQHFESGGTFLDFDPDKVREHFRREFEGARRPEGATV